MTPDDMFVGCLFLLLTIGVVMLVITLVGLYRAVF